MSPSGGCRCTIRTGPPSPMASGLHGEYIVDDWVTVVLVLAGWWVLQAFVLPRLGVPT